MKKSTHSQTKKRQEKTSFDEVKPKKSAPKSKKSNSFDDDDDMDFDFFEDFIELDNFDDDDDF